jgi:hypothetical protein
MALREKMAPSETVMAPNAERGRKKHRGLWKEKGEKNEKEKERERKYSCLMNSNFYV